MILQCNRHLPAQNTRISTNIYQLYFNTSFHTRVLYLDWSFEIGLGKAKPEHASYSHTNTEPGKEAEEIDDREDVLRDGVHHGQETLSNGKREDDTVLVYVYVASKSTHIVLLT